MVVNELITRIQKIKEILNSVSLDFCQLKMYPIAVYYNGMIYTDQGEYMISEIENISDYAIINFDNLYDDDVVNAGYCVKIMAENNFYRKKDVRIPNDLLALDYPNVYLNYDYLSYERKLLMKGLTISDRYVKLNYLRMFLNIRDLRDQIIGTEFSVLEYQLETIEGLSQYAMYRFMISYDKKYQKFFKNKLTKIEYETASYFSFRYRNKYSGLMMLLYFEEFGLNIERLYSSSDTLYQLAIEHFKFIKEPIPIKSDKQLLENLYEYDDAITEKFTIYFENDPKKIFGSWQIYQYDPLRIYKNKSNIYHESFVVLKSLLDNELLYLEGPIITKVMENSIDIVTCYYRLGG